MREAESISWPPDSSPKAEGIRGENEETNIKSASKHKPLTCHLFNTKNYPLRYVSSLFMDQNKNKQTKTTQFPKILYQVELGFITKLIKIQGPCYSYLLHFGKEKREEMLLYYR